MCLRRPCWSGAREPYQPCLVPHPALPPSLSFNHTGLSVLQMYQTPLLLQAFQCTVPSLEVSSLILFLINSWGFRSPVKYRFVWKARFGIPLELVHNTCCLASEFVLCLLFPVDFSVLSAQNLLFLYVSAGCFYDAFLIQCVCLLWFPTNLRAPWGPSVVHGTYHRAWHRSSHYKPL